MLRATWMAQEILTTFDNGSIGEVRLKPQFEPPGGDFRITVDESVVWDRRIDKGFPQPKELKSRIRDAVSPSQNLGHIDR